MIEKFMELFAGLPRAYGTYKLTGETSKKGKAEGRATTIQEPVTEQLWVAHLAGRQGLGIVPIRDDGSVVFGVIDIDEYDLDLKALELKIKKLKLPVVMFRSKSGGAHLYVFLKAQASAKNIRHSLGYIAELLGYPGIEVFPKQNHLAGQDDVGNWINMPYFAGDRTTRYCIKDGKSLTVEQFLKYVETRKTTIEDLMALEQDFDDVYLEGAPPCLIALARSGVGEGMRNDVMFSFSVFAHKASEDPVNILNHVNDNYMQPPLTQAELAVLIRAGGKKDYFYKCSALKAVCNKERCRQSRYGIGDGPSDPGLAIDGITKICSDPPTWVVQINGSRIRMSTDELLTQSKFGKRCVESINFLPPTLKAPKWVAFINAMLAERREVEAPPDAGPAGQFMHHLEQFCVTKAPANSRDEILLGKPWHDEESGRTFFRSADLFKYLEQQRFRDLKENQIYALLHDVANVKKDFFNLKGRGVNVWGVPTFDRQTEDFDVPRVPEEEF